MGLHGQLLHSSPVSLDSMGFTPKRAQDYTLLSIAIHIYFDTCVQWDLLPSVFWIATLNTNLDTDKETGYFNMLLSFLKNVTKVTGRETNDCILLLRDFQ